MNFCPSSRQRLFLGLAPIFLFVGLAAMAQQAADDKSKTEIPRAGVNGVGMPRCEYCPDPEYSKEAKKEEVWGFSMFVYWGEPIWFLVPLFSFWWGSCVSLSLTLPKFTVRL